MPKRLEVRIKSLKRHSCYTAFFWWILVVLGGLEIEAFLSFANAQIKYVLFVLICICLCSLKHMESYKRKQETKMIHQISIPCTNIECLIASLGATYICHDAYVVMQCKDNYRLRILVQYISTFDANLLSKQRKIANSIINKQYKIKNNLSQYDALKMLRVNLVVCDEMSDRVLQWVERDTEHLLGRNESVLNVAVILNQGILLFPDCLCGPTYIEIKKYELAAKALCYSLGVY